MKDKRISEWTEYFEEYEDCYYFPHIDLVVRKVFFMSRWLAKVIARRRARKLISEMSS